MNYINTLLTHLWHYISPRHREQLLLMVDVSFAEILSILKNCTQIVELADCGIMYTSPYQKIIR